MPKFAKGWSNEWPSRSRATHLVDPAEADWALCGAPVRVLEIDKDWFPKEKMKILKSREVCDHCQNARRSLK